MSIKKIFVFLTIFLFIELTFTSVIECKILNIRKINKFYEDKSEELIIQSIDALSAYEYGLKVGKLFTAQYRFLNDILRIFGKQKMDSIRIEQQIKKIEQYYPFFGEELKGLSKSTNIDLHTLFLLQNKLYSLVDGQCTAALATGKATKNNETFLTFNVDTSLESLVAVFFSTILHRIFTFNFYVVRINTMRYKYAFWGIPILYEWPFLNEEGLGWGSTGTGLTKNESRYIDEGPGIATMLLEKLAMMTCKNVSEAATLYTNVKRASQKGTGWFHRYDGSSACFCDKEGGIVIIEQTHQYIITVFGDSTDITGAPAGILWHANHHQWLDPNLTGSVYPHENPSSALRAERTYELLSNNYADITLETCKKITRDHEGGFDKNGKDSGDICRHPDEHSLRITAFSWIIMPKELTVFWTHVSPCRGIFFKYNFSKIFNT